MDNFKNNIIFNIDNNKNIYYNNPEPKNADVFNKYHEEATKLKQKLEARSNIAEMNQIVVSTPDKPIIGTTALDTCYGIVFYDRNNKRGIVGHAAPNSNKTSMLYQMIQMLGSAEKLEIEYAIVPGYRNVERKDHSGEEELFRYLMDNKPENVTFVPFPSLSLFVKLCPNVYAYEFAFDVITGRSVSNLLFYDIRSLEEPNKLR